MASTLVDANTWSMFSQVPITGYDPSYLLWVCRVAHGICADYLRYDPAIQSYSQEYGDTQTIHTGRDAYQITFTTRHKPFASQVSQAVGGVANTGVFTALSLLFPAPFPTLDLFQSAGALNAIVTRRETGRVYVPFLGVGGLPAIMFQYGGGSTPIMSSTGYLASYTAGYAITQNDLTNFPTAATVPITMQKACALIAEVLLAQETRLSQDLQSALAGYMRGFKNLEYSEMYENKIPDQLENAILSGTQQGTWAKELLDRHARSVAGRVMLI